MNQSSLKEGKNVSGIELIEVFDFFFPFFFGQKEDSKSFKITLRTGTYKTSKLLICFLIISVGSNRFFFLQNNPLCKLGNDHRFSSRYAGLSSVNKLVNK